MFFKVPGFHSIVKVMEGIGEAIEGLCEHIADLININLDFLKEAYDFAAYIITSFVNGLDSIFTWLR